MARLPVGAEPLSSREYRTLVALVGLYRSEGSASVRRVARTAGIPSNSCFRALRRLRDLGFVAWAPGRIGTLRPLVEPVALAGDGAP